MKFIELRSITEPVVIEANEHWGALFEDMVREKRLLMFGWSGVYWLVPHEVMKECDMAVRQCKRNEDALSPLPPITITLQQCIPIPGETAKILLEL